MLKKISSKEIDSYSKLVVKKKNYHIITKEKHNEIMKKVLKINGVLKLLDIMQRHNIVSKLGEELISVKNNLSDN